MSELCPVYLSSGDCLVKVLSNPRLSSFIAKIQLDVVIESWGKDCQGNRNLCTFKHQIEEQSSPEPEPTPEPIIDNKTKISIHKIENPYLVKADVLVYPTNIGLTIDDPLLNKMSRGVVQNELDRFQKPINMGTV
jgi:hypothetical protein